MRFLLCLLVIGCADPVDQPARPTGGGKADGGRAILLDCNTSLGPDQQVTVLDDGDRMILRELTTSGSQVERDLPADEWDARSLRLREDWGATSTLSKEDGDWILRSIGGGVNEFGFADCWVDESR